jgi:hypothetical protein
VRLPGTARYWIWIVEVIVFAGYVGLPNPSSESLHKELSMTGESHGSEMRGAAASMSVSFADTGNVDITADDAVRVQQLWTLIGNVATALGDSGDVNNAMRFMLHLAWHEGARITARVQAGQGPARSFYQLEREKAIDAVDYANTKNWVGLLADAAGLGSGNTQPILDALNQLQQDPSNPNFPDPNLIEQELRTVDLFGTYMARIALRRLPDPIGPSNQDHAQYWADHWKIVFDSDDQKAALIAQFKQEADAVDQYPVS